MAERAQSDHADSGWADVTSDDYQERVLRNEGRLQGLERLVAATRESDRELIEQRSESLARELERRADALLELVTARADAVLALGHEERKADRSLVTTVTNEAEKRNQLALSSLREIQDTAIRQNYEQSREAISALEQRRIAASDKLDQMVRQWRDSDKEARDLFARELDKHLDALNHNNERMREFQAQSVTRELWQSEKDASIIRESVLRDQIVAIDRVMLTMTPIVSSDKAHSELQTRFEKAIEGAVKVLDNKIGVTEEKLAELKTYRDTTQGKSSGYSSFYGWGVAAITVIIAVVVMVNTLIAR